jgi:hypothetical protein
MVGEFWGVRWYPPTTSLSFLIRGQYATKFWGLTNKGENPFARVATSVSVRAMFQTAASATAPLT